MLYEVITMHSTCELAIATSVSLPPFQQVVRHGQSVHIMRMRAPSLVASGNCRITSYNVCYTKLLRETGLYLNFSNSRLLKRLIINAGMIPPINILNEIIENKVARKSGLENTGLRIIPNWFLITGISIHPILSEIKTAKK